MKLNGAAVRAIRMRMGLTQEAAALAAGVSQKSWSRWERDRAPITPPHLEALRNTLRLDDVTAILAVPESDTP